MSQLLGQFTGSQCRQVWELERLEKSGLLERRTDSTNFTKYAMRESLVPCLRPTSCRKATQKIDQCGVRGVLVLQKSHNYRKVTKENSQSESPEQRCIQEIKTKEIIARIAIRKKKTRNRQNSDRYKRQEIARITIDTKDKKSPEQRQIQKTRNRQNSDIYTQDKKSPEQR